jgi:hypothetical protein
MFLMSDTTNFSKRRSKVKSFIRKGKVVRSYDRSIRDRLTDVAIGATGTALLGGAYLLGKRNGARSLDEVKSLIKNIKPEVVVNVPTPIVNVTNTPSVVREVINNTLSNNTVKEVSSNLSKVKEVVEDAIKGNVIKVDITRIPLPKRVDNLTEFAINKTTRDAAKMTDTKLEQSIGLVNKRLKKYAESNEQLSYLERLEISLNQLKTGKHNYTDSYLRKEIILYRDSLGLPKIEPDKLVIESIVDKDYITRLKKSNGRDTVIKQIYQSELTKRRKVVTNITTPTDDDIDRLSGMLDDFSSSRRLALFNDTKSRRSFFLTDTNVPKLSKLLNR